MAVKKIMYQTKIELDLSKGTQTVPNVKHDATADEMYTVGNAVGDLVEETVRKIYMVQKAQLS